MSQSYPLPLKFRFLIWLINRFESTTYVDYTLDDIKRLRVERKRDLLVNWVLGKPVDIYSVENRQIPVRDGEIGIRIYRPNAKNNLPVIINFHGGGWVIGSLQNNDYYCHLLTREVEAVVISVDYRLAPEYKHPTQTLDGYDALNWAHQQAGELGWDSTRIGITGDSAGANMAAVCCLMTRDQEGPEIHCQVLIYPATDATLSATTMETMSDAPILSKENVVWFRSHYLQPDQDLRHPYLSPLFAKSHADLPPCLIITADYDPLKEDGFKYAEKLKNAGADVQLHNFEREVHGFMSFPNHSASHSAALALAIEKFKIHLY